MPLPPCTCGHRETQHKKAFSATNQPRSAICMTDGCHCTAYQMNIQRPSPMECPDGYVWGTLDRSNSRTHLVKAEPWNRVALCGVNIHGDGTDYGTRDDLCPKCLRALKASAP